MPQAFEEIRAMNKQTKTEAKTMTFRNSNEAFDQAIRSGRLSASKGMMNYAGDYMYMGTEQVVAPDGQGQGILVPHDLFKNIQTRLYDV